MEARTQGVSMTARVLAALLLLPAGLPAQTPAAAYEPRYAEVQALAPRADRVAIVSGLVLTRDVARFTLSSGTLSFLSTVGGRTVGAVFVGRGTFSFTPPTAIEQARLARFEKTTTLDAPFRRLVLLFADSTVTELERALHFGPGIVGDEAKDAVHDALSHLTDDDSKSFEPDLMAAFLNGDTSDLFYAHVDREHGGPVMFELDPADYESVTLGRRAPRIAWTQLPEVICEFPPQGAPPPDSAPPRGRPRIHAYRADVAMRQTGSGDLSFAAGTRLVITTPVAAGPWVPLALFSKLTIDSARWDGGDSATVFRGKDATLLWVKLDGRLAPGDTRPLLLYYHGDLIDRYGDFFFIKDPNGWLPQSLDGPTYATFDLTYHTPSQYSLASVGDLVDSSVTERVRTTRWVTSAPIRFASFNLGLFEDYQVHEPGVPPVTIMVSEKEHRLLGRVLVQQRHMKETVGTDVAQSLKFFEHMYGPLPLRHFYATEVPYLEGTAFPGLIDLSWATFQMSDRQGGQEVFRAHEVAHQWWGIGVDVASYHDRWLAEGFADFSGLWFLQVARKDNGKYFDMLHRWRADILLHKDEPSPIWLGYRASSSKDENGYDILIYQKGAWVLHMLRVLLLDLNTMQEDRFTGMMQDYYRTYRGRRASTADFQRVVERAVGIPMDWFFQEWVYGTAIPTYRVAWKSESAGNGHYRVRLRVKQEGVPPDFEMYVPLTVDLGGGREARLRVRVTGASSEIALPLLPAEPRGLTFNALDGVLCQVKMEGW
jgi:Peptidase family M1 domain